MKTETIDKVNAVAAWYNANKGDLAALSGLPEEGNQLAAWVLWELIKKGVNAFPSLPPFPDITLPNMNDFSEIIITISIFLPFISRIYPKKVRRVLMTWAALKIFGKGSVYSWFGISPEDRGSYKKASIDVFFIAVEEAYPPRLISGIIRSFFESVPRELSIPVGSIIQDMFGNEYEFTSGGKAKILHDAAFTDKGKEFGVAYNVQKPVIDSIDILSHGQLYIKGSGDVWYNAKVTQQGSGEKIKVKHEDIKHPFLPGKKKSNDISDEDFYGLGKKLPTSRDYEPDAKNRGGLIAPIARPSTTYKRYGGLIKM